MKEIEFGDLLYGRVRLPAFFEPFIRLPEFVRLRGVRLSNVDSYEFKDFSGPTRWEHGIAVASLAWRCGERRDLQLRDLVQLTLAGLLHDVATPPFAHTAEYVLAAYDHEVETQHVLAAELSTDSLPDLPVFASELPHFADACASLSRRLRINVSPDEVARLVTGAGDIGWLIAGTLDLDNADNVVRACAHIGIEVERSLPLRLADWLAEQASLPLDIEAVAEPAVRAWLQYRQALYEAFFTSSSDELGRQAFLQHLMRTALHDGFPRRQLVWNTDDGLLRDFEMWSHNPAVGIPLAELTRRYRLLEPTLMIFSRGIASEDEYRALALPQAVDWIEGQLRTDYLEPFVLVAGRRWGGGGQQSLFTDSPGALMAFKLGSEPKYEQLPDWLRAEVSERLTGQRLLRAVGDVVSRRLPEWSTNRPWLAPSESKRTATRSLLDSIGDWSFRQSRNENFHAYPGTFVHAIPASLINALGLRGELVVDPFGGTGQTALETIKYGGTAVTGDVNSVALLVARARFAFLDADARAELRALNANILEQGEPEMPEFPLRDQWHHPATADELARIRAVAGAARRPEVRGLMEACLSAILPETTGRFGKQHGFFADNTPLQSGTDTPPYRDAYQLFLTRIARALDSAEQLYAFFERDRRDPASELARAHVVRVDARTASPTDYGVQPGGVAGIITSPPYLGMADYTLGNRLSYYWLFPALLESDFDMEVGARRRRFSPARELTDYRANLLRFAELSYAILRPGGHLALVLGTPTARAFSGLNMVTEAQTALLGAGFESLWSRDRQIQWSRNHGYARLRAESLLVLMKPL